MFERFDEFFEGEDRRLSMTRLLMFLSFWPAAVVVVYEHSEATLGWFLSAFVASYIGGKTADKISQMKPAPIINQMGGGDANIIKQAASDGMGKE